MMLWAIYISTLATSISSRTTRQEHRCVQYLHYYIYLANYVYLANGLSITGPQTSTQRRQPNEDSKMKQQIGYQNQSKCSAFKQIINLKSKAPSKLLRSLEHKPILSLASKRNTKLQQLHKCIRELLKEYIVVFGIPLNMLLELLVLDKRNVTRKHHERLRGLVRELLGAVPLLLIPALLDKQTEELISEDSRAEVPRTVKPRPVSVRAAQSMSTNQSDNLLVVEAHAVEDIADVAVALGAVRETPVRCAAGDILVLAAGSPGDGGAAEFLDCGDAGEGPEVGVGDPRKLGLDGLEEVAGDFEAGVGAVVRFRGESHGGAVAAAGAGFFVVRAACVPGETEDDLYHILLALCSVLLLI